MRHKSVATIAGIAFLSPTSAKSSSNSVVVMSPLAHVTPTRRATATRQTLRGVSGIRLSPQSKQVPASHHVEESAQNPTRHLPHIEEKALVEQLRLTAYVPAETSTVELATLPNVPPPQVSLNPLLVPSAQPIPRQRVLLAKSPRPTWAPLPTPQQPRPQEHPNPLMRQTSIAALPVAVPSGGPRASRKFVRPTWAPKKAVTTVVPVPWRADGRPQSSHLPALEFAKGSAFRPRLTRKAAARAASPSAVDAFY